MTIVYVVRHAEKEKGEYYNPHLRHQDEPITAKGKRESENLWSFFADRQVSAIYISGYLRTAQTAEYVARHSDLTPIVDERLNEIDNGLFDGMPANEVQEKYPVQWKAFLERKQDFRFPQGETGEEARTRIASLLEEKRVLHKDGNILFFSHDGLIRILMCNIMGLPVYERGNFQVDFCGIMEISYQPDYNKWKLMRFNQRLFG